MDTTAGMQTMDETLTLTNTSATTSVNILGPPQITGPNQNAFMLGPSMCPPTLGPNGTCSVNVRCSPAVRPLTGTGVAASLSLSPNSTDFGLVTVDESDEMRSIMVQNTGSATVQVNQIEINGPDSGAFRTDPGNCQPQILAPGQTCSGFRPLRA